MTSRSSQSGCQWRSFSHTYGRWYSGTTYRTSALKMSESVLVAGFTKALLVDAANPPEGEVRPYTDRSLRCEFLFEWRGAACHPKNFSTDVRCQERQARRDSTRASG